MSSYISVDFFLDIFNTDLSYWYMSCKLNYISFVTEHPFQRQDCNKLLIGIIEG